MSRSHASVRVSVTNARTSSGVGGRPVRSNAARRISTSREASAACSTPAASMRASTKRSMGDRTHAVSRTAGGAGAASGFQLHHVSFALAARCSTRRAAAATLAAAASSAGAFVPATAPSTGGSTAATIATIVIPAAPTTNADSHRAGRAPGAWSMVPSGWAGIRSTIVPAVGAVSRIAK